MTKAEIVKSISESTGVDKQASMAVVESFLSSTYKCNFLGADNKQ